jgi:hypothetical protein
MECARIRTKLKSTSFESPDPTLPYFEMPFSGFFWQHATSRMAIVLAQILGLPPSDVLHDLRDQNVHFWQLVSKYPSVNNMNLAQRNLCVKKESRVLC